MVEVLDTAVLAVLTRAPSAGGKSRLFESLGLPPDPALLQALLLDTLDGVSSSGIRTVVAVTPGGSVPEVEALVGRGHMVVPQHEGSLGDRMAQLMGRLFDDGASAVALIGSDLPTLTSAPITRAFADLRANPQALVLGPATDGGYYLLAANRPVPVFSGIAWGTARVLEQTCEVASAAGIATRFVDPVGDIDTVDDLRRLTRERRPGSADRVAAWCLASSLGAHGGSAGEAPDAKRASQPKGHQ